MTTTRIATTGELTRPQVVSDLEIGFLILCKWVQAVCRLPVLLAARDATLAELERREGTSGIAERPRAKPAGRIVRRLDTIAQGEINS